VGNDLTRYTKRENDKDKIYGYDAMALGKETIYQNSEAEIIHISGFCELEW
jgi:hypothetical protein